MRFSLSNLIRSQADKDGNMRHEGRSMSRYFFLCYCRHYCLKIMTCFSSMALVIFALGIGAVTAGDGARERGFLQAFEGRWSGGGEIVAGKYKGTRFHCSFIGTQNLREVGMSLDGTCRVGLFSQMMKAKISRHPSGVFLGQFNDGAKAQGMDITAAHIGADHMHFDLNRQNLQGTMLARLNTQDSLSISLSVKVMGEFVRLAAVNLKRDDRRLAKADK